MVSTNPRNILPADSHMEAMRATSRPCSPSTCLAAAIAHARASDAWPMDSRTTATAALSYDYGNWNFTGGLSYGVLGDTHNVLQTDYNDGSVWGAGIRVGYTF